MPLAVSRQGGDIDAVERGAAHQAQRVSRICVRGAPPCLPSRHTAPPSSPPPPSAASSTSAPISRRSTRASRPARVTAYVGYRLHRRQPACRQPGVDHAAAPVPADRQQADRADGRRHDPDRRSLGQGRIAPAAGRCDDRRQHGRHPPGASPSSCASATARPTPSWSTTPTGSTSCATSRSCAMSAGISRSTAC